jgi:hypothetical protein
MNTTMKKLAIPVTKTFLGGMDMSSALMVIHFKHKYTPVKLMTMQR